MISLLKRIVGRLSKKMRIWRDVLLIGFGFVFSIILPALSELTNPSAWKDLGDLMPTIIGALVIFAIFASMLLLIAWRIDVGEKQEEKDRHEQLITELQKLGNIIKEGRDDAKHKPE